MCPEGYVRGLRERYDLRDDAVYVPGRISSTEVENMNGFIRSNLEVLGVKNKKLLMFDLDGTLAESKMPIGQDI